MLIGKYICDREEMFIHFEDGKYFRVYNDEKILVSKAYVSELIYNYWDDESIHNRVEQISDIEFKAIKLVPIYDWILFEIYGYGETPEEASKQTDYYFKDLINYHEMIENNIERNKSNFMKSIKKFGFLPKNREEFDIKKTNFDDYELIYFEDSELDFRNLAIKNGVPSDARADGPIFGYVKGNQLVFFKFGFIKGQLEHFDKLVQDNYLNIANYYGLVNFTLYKHIEPYYKREVDEKGILLEDIISKDFEYYIPVVKVN